MATAKKMFVVKLKPHESLTQKAARDRLKLDAATIHETVREQPGIPDVYTIADQVGLTERRVRKVIKRINRGETGLPRLEYGVSNPNGGPFAGTSVRGWYSMDSRRYHHLMGSGDRRDTRIELSWRYRRLHRHAQAQGYPGKQAAQVVDGIAASMGVEVEALTLTDLEAFEDLITEKAEEEAKAVKVAAAPDATMVRASEVAKK